MPVKGVWVRLPPSALATKRLTPTAVRFTLTAAGVSATNYQQSAPSSRAHQGDRNPLFILCVMPARRLRMAAVRGDRCCRLNPVSTCRGLQIAQRLRLAHSLRRPERRIGHLGSGARLRETFAFRCRPGGRCIRPLAIRGRSGFGFPGGGVAWCGDCGIDLHRLFHGRCATRLPGCGTGAAAPALSSSMPNNSPRSPVSMPAAESPARARSRFSAAAASPICSR